MAVGRFRSYVRTERGTELNQEQNRTPQGTHWRTPMKTFSLSGAAKATGKSKSVLSNAIKKGILSASKGSGNAYIIDASELHRVYGIEFDEGGSPLERTVKNPSKKNETEPPKRTAKEHDFIMLERALNAESQAAVLRAELEGVKARLEDAIGQGGLVDVHKDSAEQAKQEAVTLRALLTDQREQKSSPVRKWFWQR